MSDQQTDLAQDLNFDDFNLSEAPQTDTAESQNRDGAPRYDLQQDSNAESSLDKMRKMSLFSRIPVTLTLEVASVEISLAELMTVNNDSVIELDKLAGEPLDIKVNGILFGKAEVVVLNDKYGLRIIEFNSKDLGELAR
ncbi:flagellar motor switch protein FliN [Hafnia alvei]|uniref:Flagellar motor switch protein FliN n=1 Tax=Hafnia alvei TaxID=569 RepID=A0A1C6Z4P5_HAFAL|nr:flagellar motor switch protein FliN [Hafnia alvei]NLS52815.1 flagellar motor switch protein FliN [Hafnia alvei]SCM54048.1 flagellar motor switch protein FliN/FliY [Hafnia alvei]